MAVIKIDIHVSNLAEVLAIFDRIEVWRSTTGPTGTYSEVTAPSATSATLDGSNTGPFTVAGQTLSVEVDGAAPVDITFTGTGDLDLATVISQINNAVPGLASEVPTSTNRLRLTSPTTGTGSSLLVSGGAVGILGLSTAKVNGRAARITLTSPTTDYTFTDLDADATYYYKTRYSSSTTSTVSSFSDPSQGVASTIIATTFLSRATIDLATSSGQPIADRRVIFVPISSQLVDGAAVLQQQDRVVVKTNAAGHAEVDLVIGATVKVFIEGTSFSRTFTVPNQATFDVMTVAPAEQDPLSIVATEPPRPIRRT